MNKKPWLRQGFFLQIQTPLQLSLRPALREYGFIRWGAFNLIWSSPRAIILPPIS